MQVPAELRLHLLLRSALAHVREMDWRKTRAEGWLRVAVWLLLANGFHLIAIGVLVRSSSVGQIKDAAHALSAQPLGSWLSHAILPALYAGVIATAAALALGYGSLRKLSAVASAYALDQGRVTKAAVIAVPVGLATLTSTAALAWIAGYDAGSSCRPLAFIAFIGIQGAVLMALCRAFLKMIVGRGARLRNAADDALIGATPAWLSLLAVILLACMWFAFGSDADNARDIGPLGILHIGVMTWAAVLGACLISIPLLINWLPGALAWLCLLAAVGLHATDSYRLQAIVNPNTPPPQARSYENPADALHRWLLPRIEHLDPTAPIPVVMVAADGGGIRAGYWAARSLAVLNQETSGNLARFTFAYSGVSGGSLGLATFVDAAVNLERDPAATLEAIDEFFAKDLLSAVAGRLLTLEPLRYFSGSSRIRGRDVMFEKQLSEDWRTTTGSTAFETSFLDVIGPVPGRALPPPLLIFNATVAETGKRLEISNIQEIERRSVASQYFTRNDLVRAPDLTLIQAIHLSARFPGISPPAAIYAEMCDADEQRKYRERCTWRLQHWATGVDGGFNDNSGIAPISNLLSVLTRARSDADALVRDPKLRAAATADELAKALLLSRVSFHIFMLSNAPERQLDPFHLPGCPIDPTNDLSATLGALDNARQRRSIDTGYFLEEDVRRLRRELRANSTVDECKFDVDPRRLPPAAIVRRAGCQRLPDSYFSQNILYTLPPSSEPRKSICPRPSLLGQLPLGWSLSVPSQAMLRNASDQSADARLKMLTRLRDYWAQ